MRTLTVSLLAGLSSLGITAVEAADLDYGVLRGSDYDTAESVIDWSGVYVGGHAGYSVSDVNFRNAGRTDLAQILRSTEIESQYTISQSNTLRPGKGRGASFGAILGYNLQFDDTVIGIEADYTSFNQAARSQDSLVRSVTLTSGLFDTYRVSTDSEAKLIDYGTIRARGGFAFGPLMPFLTAGLAFGRANISNKVEVSVREYRDAARTVLSGGLDQAGGTVKEKYALGLALGGGIDYAITSNIFLRAEYQYIQFADFGDHKIHVNTVRGGAVIKF